MEPTNGELESIEGWETGNHVFILSTSGKPVYSRYGSEDRLATLSGVMHALVSFVQSSGDSIRRIRAGKTTIEFLVTEPVTFVAVARNGQTGIELHSNLTHLNNLLLFILTSSQLQKIYKERKNFDLRRLLAGSERLIHYLIDSLPTEPGFFLSAVPCLLLDSKIRRQVANTITQVCQKIKEVVFGLMIVNRKIICQLRMSRYRLHPFDALLILNLVASTEAFKGGEHWTPICLPQFDSSGFLHAYISYLSPDCQACLLLLTVHNDAFYLLSDAKKKLVDRLQQSGNLHEICSAESAEERKTSSLNIPEVRHFLYVLLDSGTYFWPKFEPPYDTNEAKNELIAAYHTLHDRLVADKLKQIFIRRNNECIFVSTSGNSQLYLVMQPFILLKDVADYENKVLLWISKQEDLLMREDFLF